MYYAKGQSLVLSQTARRINHICWSVLRQG